MTRRDFVSGGLSFAAVRTMSAGDVAQESGRGIRVRFLGTGVGMIGRRQSSVLLEEKVLIDLTLMSAMGLPESSAPEAIFYTHSHEDHYNPEAALRAGVRRVYVHESWAAGARSEFVEAALNLGVKIPEVRGVAFGEQVAECGLTFTSVPANHTTDRVTNDVPERTSIYLVEKGVSRLLYATDTSGIPGDAARMIGIDPHVSLGMSTAPHVHKGAAITALIMDATMGPGDAMDVDYRMFMHSSVRTVERTVRMLMAHKRLNLPEGQRVYLTHMAVGYGGLSDGTSEGIPYPLVQAYDGLEVTIG